MAPKSLVLFFKIGLGPSYSLSLAGLGIDVWEETLESWGFWKLALDYCLILISGFNGSVTPVFELIDGTFFILSLEFLVLN